MNKMTFMAAIGASALTVAGMATIPTAAQAQRYYERGHDYGRQLDTSYVDGLEWRINNAMHEGRISRGHARQLLGELRSIQPLAWRVQTGQASRWEYQRLASGVSRIEQATNSYAWNGRNPRYGYNRY